MAKRGWKATHRVRFVWIETPEIRGVRACYSKGEAESKRDELLRNSANNGSPIDITIEEIR